MMIGFVQISFTGVHALITPVPAIIISQTISLYIVLAIVSVVLAFLMYRWRSRFYEKREMELVALVEKRTKSLMEEKQRVEQALYDAQTARTLAEKQREIAEEATKLKSRLLHLAAHDLKSPLISINGFNQIIRNESLRDKKLASILEMSDMIHTLTATMISLINQLLNSEAIESGLLTLTKRRVEVCKIAREIVNTNMVFASNKGQTIRFDPSSSSGCYVDGDESRLRDAFDNLVTNAIKYSPNDAPIDIFVRHERGRVFFSVQDYGPGLTEEDKTKIFRKFQRLSAQPTAGESTTGLGLSITKEIVDLHDGKIHVESEPGKGSRFTIELKESGNTAGDKS